MDGIEAAARLVIGTTFPRLFQLGERTEFRIGKLTWTTDASTFIISNDRISLLCRVSEIIFGKRYSFSSEVWSTRLPTDKMAWLVTAADSKSLIRNGYVKGLEEGLGVDLEPVSSEGFEERVALR